jgi:hypothetical protein
MEPEHILAASMFSLLGIGLCAQGMQSMGGCVARAAPIIVLGLLLLISMVMMVALQGHLSSSSTKAWRVDDDDA